MPDNWPPRSKCVRPCCSCTDYHSDLHDHAVSLGLIKCSAVLHQSLHIGEDAVNDSSFTMARLHSMPRHFDAQHIIRELLRLWASFECHDV